MEKTSSEILLRSKIQTLVRSLGVFRSQTPCGRPISVSGAHALMILAQTNINGLSQKTLQQFLNLDKSNVARLCMNLENEELIKQERSDQDARLRMIRLTKKGEKLSAQLLADSLKRFQGILGNIPKKFHPQIFQSLDLLKEAIEIENNK